MRLPSLAVVIVLALPSPPPARALEVESDLSMGREFAWLTTDLHLAVGDDLLTVGAGFALQSDWARTRAGARALVDIDREQFSVGVLLGFAPAQAGRGWAELSPHGALRFTLPHVELEAEGRLTVRHVDAGLRAGPSTAHAAHVAPIDQLRLEGELTATFDERWHLSLLLVYSFYDRDLAAPALAGADLGPAVALAGGPERWAVAARAGPRIGRLVRIEAGLAGVAFADGRGGAVVPRVVLRIGPVRGFTVEPSAELVVPLARAGGDAPHVLGGMSLTYER
jgi:hypothetical protein